MRHLPLIFFMLVFAAVKVSGQTFDTYDYATVIPIIGPKGIEMAISFSNGEYKEEVIDKSDIKSWHPGLNMVPVLKYISEMSKDGWEVVNFVYTGTAGAGNLPAYLLKRKHK